MGKEVLLIGYGSIGRRHTVALSAMGIRPYVLTRHPGTAKAEFITSLAALKGERIENCIISSFTARHLKDFEAAVNVLQGLKRVLIEKPLEDASRKGERIARAAKSNNIRVYVAYNLRFLRAFKRIKNFLRINKRAVKIVEVCAGQDLRQWRPARKLEDTYSGRRALGGGVDLDLSHEIDYILWLFGAGFKKKFILRRRISALNIDSPDICKLIMDYGSFIVDVTLDYIRRPPERYIKIACDNGRSLYFDLIKGSLAINGKTVLCGDTIDKTYPRLLKVFLSGKSTALCSLDDGLKVLEVLGV